MPDYSPKGETNPYILDPGKMGYKPRIDREKLAKELTWSATQDFDTLTATKTATFTYTARITLDRQVIDQADQTLIVDRLVNEVARRLEDLLEWSDQ